MKKFLSVLLAVIMSVSVMAIASISAFAVESPTATTAPDKDIVIQVNGKDSTDVKYTFDDTEIPYHAEFEYVGPGRLVGWEDNMQALGFVLGVDYTRTIDANGKLKLEFLTQAAGDAFIAGDVVVNAIVEFDGETTTVPVAADDSSKSPSTGLATSVIAGSIAVAGAGVAVLSATKKKDAE